MADAPRSWHRGLLLAALSAGLIVGGGLLWLDDLDHGTRTAHAIEIRIDGMPSALTRDVFLPAAGWTLQVVFTPPLAAGAKPPPFEVELREERSGMTVSIQDALVADGEGWTWVVPEDFGLREGLLAIRARAAFEDGSQSEAWRRIRIRAPLGGPPIGDRQIIHFDFSVDRDGDGRADFEADLASLGLAATDRPELARQIAGRVAQRALARVERAFDDPGDPNRTGRSRDPVAVRFQLDPVELLANQPFTTRICVGGRDPDAPGSVGHVRFDRVNARRSSIECEEDERAGLFPAELAVYAESPLFREVFDPFRPAAGGTPLGLAPGDETAIAQSLSGAPATPTTGSADEAKTARRTAIERAITVLGDALGTLMAHEAGHALGLVAPGKPPYGLFGGGEGDDYAHAVDPAEAGASGPSLMQHGRRFRFEELAGEAAGGELRFRPIDYAYLRDRLVLRDERNTSL